MLDTLLGKTGLLQILSHLWVYAQVSILTVFFQPLANGGHSFAGSTASTAHSEVCAYYKIQGGETPFTSFGICCYIPQFPQGHFCFWIFV